MHLRQLSGAINFIFKNHVKRTSYTFFQPDNNQFMYTNEVTDRSIACGAVLFKMSMDVIKPHIMIDHRSKERELEDLTLKTCQNNIHTYLKTMQEKIIDFDIIRKDSTTYNMQRMKNLLFDKLFKTRFGVYLEDVKRPKSEWIKYPMSFNTAQKTIHQTHMYTY